MSSMLNGSPPPYESEPEYDVVPQTAHSYYADDELQHFYRWTSPPGIIKIMAIICTVLCVGVFVCVASTLAWDTSLNVGGYSGGGYSSGGYPGVGYPAAGFSGGGFSGASGTSFGGGYGGVPFGYGLLDSQVNPRQAKGFMITLAIIVFIAVLALFIVMLSHKHWAQSRKCYLVIIIGAAILALLMFVATIVYFVGVNPMAQSSGALQYQVQTLCYQYQNIQSTQLMVNEYLYHYCVVDPQEAVAIVCGFLILICLIVILVFAIITRKKMNAFGKENILWHKKKPMEDPDSPQDIEDWVNNVSGDPGLANSDFPEKFGGSREHLDDYDRPPADDSLAVEHVIPAQNSAPYYSSSDMGSSSSKPKKKRAGRPHRTDGKDYDTDYASSGDELDDHDFSSEFPPIADDRERDDYKREFDQNHQDYKLLQAELDEINKRLAEVDHELDELQEGSPQYLDVMDEYNALKDKKRSNDYRMKKKKCKDLKAKLSHIKRMVSDYDGRR